jgi:N-sulfoglucosamine sulfohydrolase
MKPKMSRNPIILLFALLLTITISCKDNIPEELPNILWITSEDNSPFLGCYGDEFATTPNLDKLASEGLLYTHAYANAPVCAPARNTIITGVYANSGGHEHMRSTYEKSDDIHYYTEYLREKGYYCSNNWKEDYNISMDQTKNIWDERGRSAHYKNRAEGQPFFAIFNSTLSHESSIHKFKAESDLRHRPEDVRLPPYHPDTKEMRHDWAHYYDNVEDMDTWVGEMLKELEESGEAENTIVFYYGDHGGVLGRSKRFIYESGTRVPFIIRIPDKYKYLLDGKKPGDKESRFISFVDLAPTLLSIIGTQIPDYMQGKAFLGTQKTDEPEYAFMFRGRMDERYDMSRAVRNREFRYIKNYMSFRPNGQPLDYLWLAPSMPSWEKAFNEGRCNAVQSAFFLPKPAEQLFHTKSDPWEVNNLVGDPDYKEVLEELRSASINWVRKVKDAGFIPEPIRNEIYGNISMYDVVREPGFPLNEIIDAAEMSTSQDAGDIPIFIELLNSENPAVRYWGAIGLLNLGENAEPAKENLMIALNDEYATVSVVAAEALYILGEHGIAKDKLLQILDVNNEYVRCFAMNTIDCRDIDDQKIKNRVISMKSYADKNPKNDDGRMVARLIKKWGLQ